MLTNQIRDDVSVRMYLCIPHVFPPSVEICRKAHYSFVIQSPNHRSLLAETVNVTNVLELKYLFFFSCLNLLLKGKDNQKLKLSFTHPHVVPDLHDFLSFFRQRLKKIFWKMSNGFSHIQLNFVSDLSFLVELSL